MTKFFILIFKILVTTALGWLVIRQVDFAQTRVFLSSSSAFAPLMLCIGLFLAQAGMAAVRIRFIMRLLGEDLPARLGFSTWMVGLLFSHVLITFIAGDVARILQLARQGYRRKTVASAVFLERALGLAVLMVMIVPAASYLLSYASSSSVQTGLIVLLLACVSGVVCFVGSSFIQRIASTLAPKLNAQRFVSAVVDVTSAARYLSSNWSLTAAIIGLSVVMHVCNVLAFFVLLGALGVDISFIANAAVSLTAILLAFLPIALAGWGVREGAAVVGYGLFGVPAELALTASVGFGIALLLTCLIGVPYLLATKRGVDGTEQKQRA